LIDTDRQGRRDMFAESGLPKVVIDFHMRKIDLLDHLQRLFLYIFFRGLAPLQKKGRRSE